MIPNILSIAGSDCSGGAGIQADIKAISANGGYAMSVLTAITAQNTHGVSAVSLCDPSLITAQLSAIREDIRVDAIKIGMLGDAAITRCVAEGIRDFGCPIVLDPVMVAKSGDRLLQASAIAALRALLPRVSLITPNLPEAADLLGLPEARTAEEMQRQATALLDLRPGAVLLKGGHLGGGESPDLLITQHGEAWFPAPRVPTKNTHGTGCTYSSAIATGLGAGLNIEDAVHQAKAYIGKAIAGADRLSVGSGHGPVNHFHTFHSVPEGAAG